MAANSGAFRAYALLQAKAWSELVWSKLAHASVIALPSTSKEKFLEQSQHAVGEWIP